MKAIVLLLMCIVYLSLTGQSVDYLAEKGALRISGFETAAPGDMFSVRLLQEGATELPPMLGTYETKGDTVFFTPRFPFIEGREYLINTERGTFRKTIVIPQQMVQNKLRVVGVYPSADQLPANQLKFYIEFSQPVRPGQILRCVQLINEDEQEVNAPFLELGVELWDPSRQRVTIWFDPGRIKRELIPNRKLGSPLEPERTYHLVIDSSLMAANGLILGKTFRKTFATTDSDRVKPSPADWQFDLPTAGTDYPFKVFFPEPMDYALLHSGMAVLNPDGTPVNGSVGIAAGETEWYFTPNEPWKDGTYTLRVSTRLEDLAGNNLKRLFDTDASENTVNTYPSSYIDLPVSILPEIE